MDEFVSAFLNVLLILEWCMTAVLGCRAGQQRQLSLYIISAYNFGQTWGRMMHMFIGAFMAREFYTGANCDVSLSPSRTSATFRILSVFFQSLI